MGMKVDRSAVVGIIEQAVEFIDADQVLLGDPSLREDLLNRCHTLLEQARQPGEVLYVGILGGTGVGKSTLINALARREISQRSDRRPFTDRAVVYRHKDTPRGLDEIAHLIREPDAEHESDTVKALVLLDLPDFDSVEEDNRRAVLEILPWLDSVVWVLSPEKYADDVFYRLVASAAINRDHFTFVLNKADELRSGGGHDPHGRIKDVLGDLSFRLKHEAEIEQPRIFSISAQQEFIGDNRDSVLDQEFSRFREFLMAERNAKEIASVKTINLVEKTRRLIRDLHGQIAPEEKVRLVQSVRSIHESGRPVEPESDPDVQDYRTKLQSVLFQQLVAEDSSFGPVKWSMGALLWARGTMGREETGSDVRSAFYGAAGLMGKGLRSDLEKFTNRIDSELILSLGGSGSPTMEKSLEDSVDEALSRAYRLFVEELELKKTRLAGPLARWRRFWQKLLMLIPTAILVVKLAGPPRVESWWNHPTVGGLVGMILSFLTSLFGAEGLIGLCVLLICEALISYYLAARRMGKMEREARQIADSAVARISEGLKSVADRARAAREQTVNRIEEGINRLEALESTFKSADGD